MGMIRVWCLLCSFALLTGCVTSPNKQLPVLPEMKILTESYPPLNFMENGRITGFERPLIRRGA